MGRPLGGNICEFCEHFVRERLVFFVIFFGKVTPPKFNMEPEHDGFQEDLSFLGTSFQVPLTKYPP